MPSKQACLSTDPSTFCFSYLASSLVLTSTLTAGGRKLVTPLVLTILAAPKRPDSRVPPRGTTLLSLKGPLQSQHPG